MPQDVTASFTMTTKWRDTNVTPGCEVNGG